MPLKSVSRITTKGQVTIPEAIRDRLDLQSGDRLEWRATRTGAVEVRKLGRDWRDLVGLLGRPARSISVRQMDDAVRDHLRREYLARR